MPSEISALFAQIGLAAIFYIVVVALFRVAGKRLAGQTTTFDLVVLISLSVAVQQATLKEGPENAAVFVITVFCMHVWLARLTAQHKGLRCFVRGKPCSLVQDGHILHSSLRAEGLSVDELMAGLRKLGIEDISQVKTAHLEETGQISAIRMQP